MQLPMPVKPSSVSTLMMQHSVDVQSVALRPRVFLSRQQPVTVYGFSRRQRPLIIQHHSLMLQPSRATNDPSSSHSSGDEDHDATSDNDNADQDRPWLAPGKGTAPLPASISFTDRIGAEYGEGFLQFRLSGEKTRLDVDTLNEALRVKGADRIRHSTMCPDEAYGLVFDFDDVIVDTRALQRIAWQNVATMEGLPYPSIERGHMFEMRPERAAMHVLQWTQNMQRAQELAWLVATEYAKQIHNIDTPLSGVVEWLEIMNKTNVPCALVTAIDKTTATNILEKMNLRHYFGALVTADDDMETIAQRYLSAAIKLNRPPNQCVVFGSTPAAMAAAHNCTMRCVAVIGPHTAPQLRSADLTISTMTELSVMNIRRLFANSGTQFMDLKKARTGQGTPKRKLRHATDGEE